MHRSLLVFERGLANVQDMAEPIVQPVDDSLPVKNTTFQLFG